MDPTTAVMMVLLSCGPSMQSCRPAETVIYAAMAECVAALPVRLEGTGLIGKCQPVAASKAVDTRLASDHRLAMVRVVRGVNAASTDYLVPRAGNLTE